MSRTLPAPSWLLTFKSPEAALAFLSDPDYRNMVEMACGLEAVIRASISEAAQILSDFEGQATFNNTTTSEFVYVTN
jgi:hypothetical protein